MTDEQLNAIEQRAGAATIEPLVRKLERAVINTEDDKAYFSLLPMLKTMKALVMDTPALIAEVRRLRDLVAELEELAAHQNGLPHDRAFVEAHQDDLILLGQGRLELSAFASFVERV